MGFRNLILTAIAPKPNAAQFLVPGLTLCGDSIMFSGVADRLKERLSETPSYSYVIHDRSIPGDTARQGWFRFPYELRSTNTVVLELGTNDIGIEQDPVPWLERMAKYALSEGRRVIFTGIVQRPLWATTVEHANEKIHQLSDRLGCDHAGWDTKSVNCPDGLHPDAEGITSLSDALYYTI